MDVLSFIGFGILLYYAFKISFFVFHNIKVYYKPKYPNFSDYGEWSVITGSTDGIGKALALQLAEKRQNIVLVARNKEKLKAVAKEIGEKYGVQVKSIQVDFCNDEDEHIHKELEENLKDLDIGVLINNVGTMEGQPRNCAEIPNFAQITRTIMRTNIFAMLKMTEIILPGMGKRRRGLISSVSSVLANVPAGGFALYGASKCFIHYFTTALSYECQNKGITVQSCLAGGVSTKLNGRAELGMFMVTPQEFAKSFLGTVGKERVTGGYFSHVLVSLIFQSLPESFSNRYIIKGWVNAQKQKSLAKQRTE